MPPRSVKNKLFSKSKAGKSSDEVTSEKVMFEWLNAFTPTEADKRRQVLPYEQAELCRGIECRVLLDRFNLVYDYAQKLKDRLKHKSTKDALKLLAKAVNRYKDDVYTEAEIQTQHEIEWPCRKKYILMQLDYWHHKSQHNLLTAQVEASQVEPSNISTNYIIDDTEPQASQPPTVEVLTNTEPLGVVTVVDTERFSQQSMDGAHIYQEIIEEFNNCNTESMTVSTQSMNMNSIKESEDIIPNTDEFNLSISMTSTQEQHVM